MNKYEIETQIYVLEQKMTTFVAHPDTGKFDAAYYKIRNKIKTLKKQLETISKKQNYFNWLAQ